mgnify:CR=1 FL=1
MAYFRGVQGVILVYDVTKRESFEINRKWVSKIHQHARGSFFIIFDWKQG